MHFFSGGGGGFPFEDFFSQQGPQEPEEEVDNTRFYTLLGVDKSISCADVKKAFRQLAKTKHPDKGGDPKEFQEITHAAEILSDPEKRKVYDRYGEKGINQGMTGGDTEATSIFDLLSGRGGRRREQSGPQRGEDATHTLKASLEEIYNGAVKKIAINRDRVCQACNGEGGTNAKTCSGCKGRGMVNKLQMIGPNMYTQSVGACDDCNGTGKTYDAKNRCKECKGKRIFQERKVIEVTIDKGIPNHHKYSFMGESDEKPGVLPGDLIVIIEEKHHEIFKRKHADLILLKKITIKEALTGYKFKVAHLDGTEKIIESTPGDIIKPGDVRTVRDLGMPIMRTPFKFGNLFVTFEVEFPPPKSLNARQIEELKNLIPGESMEIDSAGAEKHMTIEFDKSHQTENNTKIHSDYKDEEEDDLNDPRFEGARRVNCSGVIF
ncbi:unnamed protein product [Blepharisma stoltei]|uniref:Uncharacterized protein n=1 Tax=Blepharisma stoltei TaxID=1481888 RepID=A0AAU9J3C4_9CILI|nr:unnamed protein product [Blepharisma stoltei]